MEALIEQLIADFHERDLPSFTRRHVRLPRLPLKIDTIIGMRRYGGQGRINNALTDSFPPIIIETTNGYKEKRWEPCKREQPMIGELKMSNLLRDLTRSIQNERSMFNGKYHH